MSEVNRWKLPAKAVACLFGVLTKVCTKPGEQQTLDERQVSLQSLGVGRNPLKAGATISQYLGTLTERRM